MLIRCPRCGFQQPMDKYCAQCGVDMEVYQRPKPSFASRTFGNPALQIGAVLLLAGFVGLSLYQRKRKDLEDRVIYLKNETQIARGVSNPSNGAPPPPPAEPAPPASFADGAEKTQPATLTGGVSANASTTVPQADAKSLAATAGAAPAGAANTKVAVPKGLSVVRIYFAEVSRPYLAEIWEESRATGQFNSLADHVAGIIPDLAKKVAATNRSVKILSHEERAIDVGKPVQFFQGVHQGDPDGEIGLTYYIELQDSEAGVYRGSLDLMRTWREPSPSGGSTSQKRLYPAVFELAPGSGFFMSGIVDKSPELANIQDLVAVNPFQILRSSAFNGDQTEAVLFLEFGKN